MGGGSDASSGSLPIGRSGRLEAMPLTSADDTAVVVRERGTEGRARALLTTDKLPDGERLVVMPLDDEVEVRVDGDALAVWLGSGSLMPARGVVPSHAPPIWATVTGGGVLLLVIAMALIGSAVTFAWLLDLFT